MGSSARFVTITVLLSLAGLAAAADWPGWRGPDRNGVVPGEVPAIAKLPAKPRVLWQTKLLEGKGSTHASPAVAGDTVIVHTAVEVQQEVDGKKRKTRKRVLAALALADGAVRWQRESGGGKAEDTPCIADGKAFYVDGDGTLYALALADGAVAWQVKVDKKNGTNCSPLAVGDLVVVPAGRRLVAVARAGGAVRWKAPVTVWNNSPVAWRHGGKDYIIVGNKTISCLDAADGTELWTLDGTSLKKDPSSPAICGDLMATLFEGGGLRVHRLSPAGAEELVKAEGFEPQGGGAHQATSPAFDGKRVWGVDGKKTFCFDLETEKMLWTGTKGDTHASPLLAGDRLIVRGKGKTMLFDAATGEQLGECAGMGTAGCSSFAWADGKLVANRGASVVCYGLAGD